ncbi:MAG: LysR family transcriptional regulator [Betaproteobacteria bacterium]|nr:LysR family transcriptional regulator [Betaproteobacteria bacterium]
MNAIAPNNPHFDLVDLRLFVKVAEAGSLTRGAQRSFLSLAAASLRIKSLEEAVGSQLFYRAQRGVSPTQAGEVFLNHARKVLQEIDLLQGEMQPFSRGVRGNVRLFANATAISELLPAVLAKFFAIHDVIAVDLQERLSAEIVRAVHEGIADIGVISALVRADGLETLPYKKDRLVLAVPFDHPLAVVPCIQFADALDYDFIGLDSHSATHAFLQNEVALLGRGIRQRIQVGSFDAMCRMIEAGVGIGVLPEMSARRHAKSIRIKTIQLLDEWAMRELRICVRSRAELPVFARELIDFILQSP